MRIKAWLVLSLIVVSLASLASGLSYAADQNKVIVIIRTGAEADAMRAIADDFTKATGIKVEFTQIGRAGYFSSMTTQLVAGTDAFDVAFFPSTYVASYATSGAVLPLDAYIKKTPEFKFDDLLSYGEYKGKVYFIPTDTSVHIMYYRSDLIKKAPQTWPEFLEAAKKWTKALNPQSPTKYGTVTSLLPGEELPKIWYSLLFSFGGHIIDKDGNVGLDSEAALKAADIFLEWKKAKVMPEDALTFGNPDVRDAMMAGNVAISAPTFNASAPIIRASKSPYKDDIAIEQFPVATAVDGTTKRISFRQDWGLVLNASSRRKENAWKFIAWICGPEGARLYAKAGGTPPRESVLTNVELAKIRPDFPLIAKVLKTSRPEPAVVFYPEMHEAVNQALTAILNGKEAPKAALKKAADKVRELIAKYGY